MKAPNALAWLALYSWPLVVLAVYATRRGRARLAVTTSWLLILPVMFLPALLDLPFAGLNKHRIAFLSVAAALFLFHRRELSKDAELGRLPLLALAAASLGALQTVRTNLDPLVFGPLTLQPLTGRDAAWMIYEFVVDTYVPFAIGQLVFRTERDVRDLLRVLSTCALLYVPLCLLEIRLSPQLSNWVYGYFPHSFAQTRRGEGFRPVVFMNHGLSVAMFLFAGLGAALALHRARTEASSRTKTAAVLVGSVLLLARNMASVIYSGLAAVLVAWSSAKSMARVAVVLAVIVASYPMLRASGVVAPAAVGDFFAKVSKERSASLLFRFVNEDRLLARAMERPLYGWGDWGRGRVYHWWGYGWTDATVTDGTWIIKLGGRGIVGFAAFFALMIAPVFRFARLRPRMPAQAQLLLGALALLVAFAAFDLLPNSQSDFLPVVYAGVLFAASRRLSREVLPAAEPQADAERLGRQRRPAAPR